MLGLGLGTLPGKLPADQVDQDVPDGLHVVPSRLS
jgi:hypothetical protein